MPRCSASARQPSSSAGVLGRQASAAAAYLIRGGMTPLSLLQATLFVTHEPCPMCAGAILQARIGRVVYGARQPLLGADGSWLQVLPAEPSGEPRHPFHVRMSVRRGVLQPDCEEVLVDFFRRRRQEGDNRRDAERAEWRLRLDALAAFVQREGRAPARAEDEEELEDGVPVARVYQEVLQRRCDLGPFERTPLLPSDGGRSLWRQVRWPADQGGLSAAELAARLLLGPRGGRHR